MNKPNWLVSSLFGLEEHALLTLENLGWNDFFHRQVSPDDRAAYTIARVVEERRGLFRIWGSSGTDNGEWLAETSGKLHFNAVEREDLPAVGDWVLAKTSLPGDRAIIERILSRQTKISRKGAGVRTAEQVIAANVQKVIIMTSLNQDLNLRRLERYLVMAWESGALPLLVLTKADLGHDVDGALAAVKSLGPDVPVFAISSLTGQGVELLTKAVTPGETAVLVGSSGVGKSTFVNFVAGLASQKVASIRDADGRGRHTTTHRSLFPLPGGGIMIDTPGLRELALWEADDGLAVTFADIERLAEQCRYSDCRHDTESDCAIKDAIEAGQLERARFLSYCKLQREEEYLVRRKDKSAAAMERKKWKQIHKEMRHHPKKQR